MPAPAILPLLGRYTVQRGCFACASSSASVHQFSSTALARAAPRVEPSVKRLKPDSTEDNATKCRQETPSLDGEDLHSEALDESHGRLAKDDTEGSLEAGRSAPTKLNLRTRGRASRVPSSRIARVLQYGGLATGLGLGAAGSFLRTGRGSGSPPAMLTESNINRIVKSLSRMRGAALKLGQFLSIQESNMLPPELEQVLARVQNAADYMPEWQTSEVISAELGHNWRQQFSAFDLVPFAAASIGQVHAASLHDGTRVAVKVQFPGVANSIDSDISNIRFLLSFSALLPRGLYLENTLKTMRSELAQECDYEYEAACARRYRTLLDGLPDFAAPNIVDRLSTRRVLTMQMMQGIPVTKLLDHPEPLRNKIGSLIIELCLRELFQFGFMQTDPNWSNFLWNEDTQQLEVVDFGASQAYKEPFIGLYRELLQAAIRGDRSTCLEVSHEIGYLTPNDTEIMVNTHVDAMLALAEPFQQDTFSFANQDITSRIRASIPTILENRTTPPPSETYSLNRKLSGCFLLCSRLRSTVDCKAILQTVACAV